MVWSSPMLTINKENGKKHDQFKEDFLRYLTAYKHSAMRIWIERIAKFDFKQKMSM